MQWVYTYIASDREAGCFQQWSLPKPWGCLSSGLQGAACSVAWCDKDSWPCYWFIAFTTESSTHKSECHLICRQTLAIECDGAADYWRRWFLPFKNTLESNHIVILSKPKHQSVWGSCSSVRSPLCHCQVYCKEARTWMGKEICPRLSTNWLGE